MKNQSYKNVKRWTLMSMLVVLLGVGMLSFEDRDFKIAKNLDIYYTLFRELNLFYVDETDPEELVNNSIEGMLESLDPYTTYIPESEMDDFKFMTTGKYGGVGALIRKDGDYTMISEPYEGFPADKAGLKAGDVILEIDGKSIKGKSVQDVSELLKGIPETEVKLTIRRPGTEHTLKKDLTRKHITINSVPYYGMVDDNIGYIRISNFTKDVHSDVEKALKELTQNDGAEKIILDLRGNPGGLLVEAVYTANLFVKKDQEIVSTKGKVKQWDMSYTTQKEPVDTDIPLAVLISRGSASASEIVAGAVQDLDRGVLIGEKTFGKGLVQTTRPLSYNAQLKVTTAKYYIPSGRCIQALDYSNRNEDGSVGHVPDSLISEFNTQNGRKVYDGGGITPDLKVESENLSKIAISLYTKNLIFDYATQFVLEHESIPSVEDFEITDAIYDNFVAFLKDKEYDYETRSDEALKKLIETAKSEKYYQRAKEELAALEVKLAHDKEKDLETFKDEIKEFLLEEISGRYYYQKGRLKASLKQDPQLEKAIEVLNKPSDYSAILTGSYNDYAAMIIK